MSLGLRFLKTTTLTIGLLALTSSPARAEGEFLSSLEREITGLITKVKPSLVTINARQVIRSKGRQAGGHKLKAKHLYQFEKISRIGSGVVFDKEGHIITTASVVHGANEFEVSLTNGTTVKAVLKGIAPELNLAVLKMEGIGLVPAQLGNSDNLKAGSWVTILGNSYGLQTAVAIGLVNGTRPDGFIQMSASVAPGNSGGPVINSEGEIVGLVSAKVSEASSISILTTGDGSSVKIAGSQGRIDLPSSSVSLAIPINQAKKAAWDIIQHGSVQRGFLGVYLEDRPNLDGVYVSDIVKGSPAEKAGLKTGDVLVSLDGKKIVHSDQVRILIEKIPPREVLPLVVQRGGQLDSLVAQVGEVPGAVSSEGLIDWSNSLSNEAPPVSDWRESRPDMYQISSDYKGLVGQSQPQIYETQKISDSYRTVRLEARIAELEQELKAYKVTLEQMRRELEKLKVTQEGP